MFSDKFMKFIEMWQKEYAIERSIDEKVCADKDGNPIPWYTYPAIEYLSQFDYGGKGFLNTAAAIRRCFGLNGRQKLSALKIIRNGLPAGARNLNVPIFPFAGGMKAKLISMRFLSRMRFMT